MTISVIIPAFNAMANLERAVNSVLATGRDDLEIVIVEDGSNDGTLSVAKNIASRNEKFVSVKQHNGGVNRGVSASRNLGIKLSRGEYICFLDADDYFYPNRFDHALAVLMANPEIDAIYEATEMVIEVAEENNLWGTSGIFGLQQAVAPERLLTTLLKGQPWHSNAILCRSRLLQQTGGFDESLRTAEDCNLWFRMAVIGRLVGGNFDLPVAAYCRHGSNSYYLDLETRVDNVRAMVKAYRWARSKHLRRFYGIFRIGIGNYLVNALIVAREAGRSDVAKSLLRVAGENSIYTVLQPAVFRQALSLYRDMWSGKDR